ncbi:hypothetical protein D3C83_45180 [compost metagenome]
MSASKSDAARAVIAPAPIAVGHGNDLNVASAAGGVNEALVAEIDPDVRVRLAQRIEEHEIARVEFIPFH